MTHGSPSCSSVNVIRAPHGVCRSRCACRARKAVFALSPGANLTDTLALATGTSAFGASDVRGASIPRTDIAGLVHRRSTIRPVPMSDTPSSMPASARKRSSG